MQHILHHGRTCLMKLFDVFGPYISAVLAVQKIRSHALTM